jgi:hypothetical protein
MITIIECAPFKKSERVMISKTFATVLLVACGLFILRAAVARRRMAVFNEPPDGAAGKLLTCDEAGRIAANSPRMQAPATVLLSVG